MIKIAALLFVIATTAAQTLPSGPLVVRGFTLRFDPAGTFTLSGEGWPPMAGTWTARGGEVTLQNTAGPKDCMNPARYSFTVDGARVSLAMVADDCKVRQMILDGSQWLPPGASPAAPARRIVLTPGPATGALPAASGTGHWPSFRGREASGVADSQNLPERWNPATGENILWKTSIPGLSHSSPIVWGDVIFVTSAISGRKDATFKPGLYGDGDASEDRSEHRWMLYAIDRRRGRSAGSAPPRRVRRETSGTSSRRTRAHRPPLTAASSWRGSVRRASMPTTSTAACGGRSISAASTWARTTFRRSSGGRQARRSFGTAS